MNWKQEKIFPWVIIQYFLTRVKIVVSCKNGMKKVDKNDFT